MFVYSNSEIITKRVAVGLKSNGTTGQTTGDLDVDKSRATVPSLSTCDEHTTGHWPVALFKTRR